MGVIRKHFDSKNHEKNESKNSNVGGKQLEYMSWLGLGQATFFLAWIEFGQAVFGSGLG